MGTIREDVFLGTTEKYNQKLEMLAKMTQLIRIVEKQHPVSVVVEIVVGEAETAEIQVA